FNWSVLVPAGRATGSVEIDGTRTQLNGWTAYHDHVWGAFDRNWFHGDFGLRATATGDSWALEGLEPADGPSTYRWRASDARLRGVLLHVSRGHTTACAP